MRPNRAFAIEVLLVASLGARPAVAEEHDMFGPNTGAISFSTGFDIVSQYWFRGHFRENQGLILQPWIEVGFNLHRDDGHDWLNSVDLIMGAWNSFHDGPSGADAAAPLDPSDPTDWFEADLYAGIHMTIMEEWSLGIVYTAYVGPNDILETTEDLAVRMSFDDRELLGKWAMAPFVTLTAAVIGSALVLEFTPVSPIGVPWSTPR